MAIVQGIREKVHHPIYDCLTIKPEEQLRDEESSGTLRFFMNVQGKTKLQTNLQSASLLPHYNTFEARAMRVVMSDLPPEYPDDDKVTVEDDEYYVTNADGQYLTVDAGGVVTISSSPALQASWELGLDEAMGILQEANESEDGEAELDLDDEGVEVSMIAGGGVLTEAQVTALVNAGATIFVTADEMESAITDLGTKSPPREQLHAGNGSGNLISRFIYNTVTTFYVGEKIMIQMPTWFFPAGAGPYSQTEKGTTHGEPSPMATFRFAEPIFIDKQQNFRVEIEVPDSDTLKEIQKIYGPLYIWVVLDGYMTRGVQ